MVAGVINKCVKIKEVVSEHVETGIAQSNASSLEPQFVKQKKSDAQRAEGIDPDQVEIVQDFPV